MGLEKLNPFKKHHDKQHLSVEDGLEPTKSTSSFTGSIRSLNEKLEKKSSDAAKPHLPFNTDKEVSANTINPGVTTGGVNNGSGGTIGTTNLL